MLVLAGGALVGGATTTGGAPVDHEGEKPDEGAGPGIETRSPADWPFSADSVWNTPIGSGIQTGTTSHPLAVEVRSVSGTVNYSTYSTPVNIAGAEGTPLTLREVKIGTWRPAVKEIVVPRAPATINLSGDMAASTVGYNNDNSISFTNSFGAPPDGFMAIIDTVEMMSYQIYKATWDQGGPSTRRLIGRETTARVIDLKSDGMTGGGARASRFDFLGGLIRTKEALKAATDPLNAIRHALALAISNAQLLRPTSDTGYVTPGYQWPARNRDSDANSMYTGEIRMGTQFVLNPTFNIETAGLSNEGLALAYALRDYGAYVVDRSTWTTLFLEERTNATVAGRMRTDWKDKLLQQMVPVLNNSATAVGGPGTRVRPPAPIFVGA